MEHAGDVYLTTSPVNDRQGFSLSVWMSFGEGLCFPYWLHVPQILLDIALLVCQERQRVRASGIHIEALLYGDLSAPLAVRTVQMPTR